jgi:hypothetical protein
MVFILLSRAREAWMYRGRRFWCERQLRTLRDSAVPEQLRMSRDTSSFEQQRPRGAFLGAISDEN